MSANNSLYLKSARGVFWGVGAQVTSQLMHLMVRLLLARLLVPADFGLVAMAMVVVSFSWWFVDMSFGQALVQRKDLTEQHRSTAFWANMIAGLSAFLVFSLISPFVAAFFRTPHLVPVFVALSFSMLLQAPEATLVALLQREFGFRTIAVRQVGGAAFGGVVGVALALTGCGVWALVGESLVRTLSGSIFLFFQSKWRPRFEFSTSAFRELWSYSRPLIGARIVNYLNRNVDTILIGRLMGAQSLGIYNLGYQFVLLPLMYVSRSVNTVLFSALSRTQDDPKRFARAYLRAIQLVASAVFPLMALIALGASVLVPVLLGDRWAAAIPLIPFMCVAGTIQSLQSLMPAVFQAKGRTIDVLKWSLASTTATTFAVVLGLRWGLQGVVECYAAATAVMSVPLQRSLFKEGAVSAAEFLRTLFAPVAGTVLLLAVWFVADALLRWLHYGNSIRSFMISALAALASYLFVSWKWNPIIRESLSMRKVIFSDD